MRLFSSTEVVSNREAITVAEIRRLETVNKELTVKRHELEKLEGDFNFALDVNRKQFEEERAEHSRIINALKTEVEQLEARKLQNLIPLEVDAKKLENERKRLSKLEARLKEEQEDIEEKSELLQDKLTEVSQRSAELDNFSKKQTLAQQGIDSQRAQIALQAEEMSKVMISTRADFNTQQNVILRQEAVLKLKEEQLASKEKEIIVRENDFARREALLADRYAMLERTQKNASH